jgi:hypothetical protein
MAQNASPVGRSAAMLTDMLASSEWAHWIDSKIRSVSGPPARWVAVARAQGPRVGPLENK